MSSSLSLLLRRPCSSSLSLSLSSRFAENTRYETRLDLIYAFLLKAIGEGRDSRFRCFQVFPRVFRSVMERGNGVTTGET